MAALGGDELRQQRSTAVASMRRAIRDPNRLAYMDPGTTSTGRGLRFSPAPLARCRRLRFPFLATWPPGGLGKTGFITRMHEGLLGGPVRVGRDPRDTLADLSSLLSGFALPLNDLSKIGHDPPR